MCLSVYPTQISSMMTDYEIQHRTTATSSATCEQLVLHDVIC